MATMQETEITVTGVQAEKCFLIGTNWPKWVTRLDKAVAEGKATLVSVDGEWRTYKALEEHFSPVTGFKSKRNYSPEYKAKLAERMRDLHK